MYIIKFELWDKDGNNLGGISQRRRLGNLEDAKEYARREYVKQMASKIELTIFKNDKSVFNFKSWQKN